MEDIMKNYPEFFENIAPPAITDVKSRKMYDKIAKEEAESILNSLIIKNKENESKNK